MDTNRLERSADERSGSQERKEVRVIDALEAESRSAPPVSGQYSSLLGQTAAMLLAERWIDDHEVGIEAIKRVYKQIYEADVHNQKINVGLMKLKLELASRNFDIFERLIASRIRMSQVRREPMRDITSQTKVVGEVMNGSESTGVFTEASVQEDLLKELESSGEGEKKKE